jgi:hypothetical protein
MKIIKKIYNKILKLFKHDCYESKKMIALETSTFAGKRKITKIRYKCQKCFIQWEEYKN